jgi:hypothetical protein
MWVLVLSTLYGRALHAQTVYPADTTKRAPASDQRPPAGYGDSATNVGSDTGARTGAAPAQDSVAKRPDSTRAAVEAAPPAADPSLVAACKPGPDGTPVGMLLVVRFARQATDADRAAAAKGIGGRLGGDTPDGLTYVVPPADRPLRDVEDTLIRARGVRELGEQPCP